MQKAKGRDMVFFNFVDANLKLVECYGRIPEDSLKDMTKAQMDTQCQSEKIEIKRILDSNQMTMSTILKDRVAVMKANAHKKLTYTDESKPKNPGVV